MGISSYIQKHIDPNFKGNDLPFPTSQKRILPNSVLTDFNEKENRIFFIVSGIIQVNVLDPQDEIKTLDFCFENSFVTSTASFLCGKPSDVQLVAVTDCCLEVILKRDILAAYDSSLIANKLGRVEMEKVYLRRLKRERDFLTMTAKERYLELIESDSPLLKHLTVDTLAKYLGIHPSSLSRIRGEKINTI